tara:strand:- start:4967 stop:5203 length:237 start_codon:yes stop_codon:yes gene_type:complete
VDECACDLGGYAAKKRRETMEVVQVAILITIIIMVGLTMIMLVGCKSEIKHQSKRIDVMISTLRKTNEWLSDKQKALR